VGPVPGRARVAQSSSQALRLISLAIWGLVIIITRLGRMPKRQRGPWEAGPRCPCWAPWGLPMVVFRVGQGAMRSRRMAIKRWSLITRCQELRTPDLSLSSSMR